MELSYILLVCGFTYLSLSDVYCTDGSGYEFLPCSDPDILSSSRCLLREAEVDRECDCQSLCDDDDRCVYVFYNPDTKTCRLYDHNKEEKETTGLECARIVDCGVPDFGDGIDANYETTTFGSVAERKCPLGYFPTSQAVCQDNGQWSNLTGVCEVIPKLKATKELPDSDAGLECRNVISEPAPDNRDHVNANCAEDEIMTGCSTTNDSGSQPVGPTLGREEHCWTQGNNVTVGSRAVARCCKLPGLRCEYFRRLELTESVSCYKDFRLFDCVRKKRFFASGPSPILMNGNSCVIPSEFADAKAFRSAICCDIGDYFCYRKNATGLDTGGSDLLLIRCDDAGEVMTSCNGYSNHYDLFGSLIKNVAGADECQLDPGSGDVSQLYGYITCCKRNQ